MEFAEMGHRREERPDLPVSLLMVLYALRLECEKSMELTASSHRSCFCSSREDLPVSLLMVLHALRLECEKSMELTASSHRCCFCSSRESRDEAAISESVPTGAQMKER